MLRRPNGVLSQVPFHWAYYKLVPGVTTTTKAEALAAAQAYRASIFANWRAPGPRRAHAGAPGPRGRHLDGPRRLTLTGPLRGAGESTRLKEPMPLRVEHGEPTISPPPTVMRRPRRMTPRIVCVHGSAGAGYVCQMAWPMTVVGPRGSGAIPLAARACSLHDSRSISWRNATICARRLAADSKKSPPMKITPVAPQKA